MSDEQDDSDEELELEDIIGDSADDADETVLTLDSDEDEDDRDE